MLKPIKNEKQYEAAAERIYKLMQHKIKPGSKEGDELEILSLLVKDYEEKHYPIPPPDPIAAIKFRMEQMGITNTDLVKILGYRSRVSEIFSGKRKLSLEMIRTLHLRLKIPAEILIR